MIVNFFRYLVLFITALTFGCAFSKTGVVEKTGSLSPAVSSQTAWVSDEEPDIPDTVHNIGVEEVAVSESPDSTDGQVDPQALDPEKEALLTSNDEVLESEDNEENGQGLLDTALDFCDASQEYWAEGNFLKALQMLDQAYMLTLKVDIENNPELIQQKDDIRFMISKRILEIYTSRHTTINGNHNEIPMIMNQYVEREIRSFQGSERGFFMESYKRSGKYMDMMRAAFREAGLPEDLAWLPLIESGFKARALSTARALGLWQFIPSTGYKFGLKRGTWIDERLDPEKATAAAIAYMKELHQLFGDWMTVLASYNCGEGLVLRKIRNQKFNYLDNFWDLYEQLPAETARYVPRFLATLHILKDPAKYGFEFEEPAPSLSYESVTIEKQVHLKALAEEIGVEFDVMYELNPELRHQVTPPAPHSLKVPVGKGEAMLARLDSIQKWIPPQDTYATHRVRSGETLSLIAAKYRTSVSQIVKANNMRTGNIIRIGQKLKIPLRGSSSGSLYASNELMPDATYRIKKGDTLSKIAKKFNTSIKKLQAINNLDDTSLNAGQVLKVN